MLIAILVVLLVIAFLLYKICTNQVKEHTYTNQRHSETILLLRGIKAISAEIADKDK